MTRTAIYYIYLLELGNGTDVIEYLIKYPSWAPLSSSTNMHNNNQYHPHHHYHQEHHLPLSGGSKVSSYAMQFSFISFIISVAIFALLCFLCTYSYKFWNFYEIYHDVVWKRQKLNISSQHSTHQTTHHNLLSFPKSNIYYTLLMF